MYFGPGSTAHVRARILRVQRVRGRLGRTGHRRHRIPDEVGERVPVEVAVRVRAIPGHRLFRPDPRTVLVVEVPVAVAVRLAIPLHHDDAVQVVGLELEGAVRGPRVRGGAVAAGTAHDVEQNTLVRRGIVDVPVQIHATEHHTGVRPAGSYLVVRRIGGGPSITRLHAGLPYRRATADRVTDRRRVARRGEGAVEIPLVRDAS